MNYASKKDCFYWEENVLTDIIDYENKTPINTPKTKFMYLYLIKLDLDQMSLIIEKLLRKLTTLTKKSI
jgi:hypothetical protein